MNLLAPKTKWMDDWFPEWNPGYLIRPLHGEGLPSQIRIDVSETDEAYKISAELPGVNKEDIDIQIKDGLLSISAETKQEDRQEKEDQVLRSERYFGKVSRTIQLPGTVTVDECQASYDNGMLNLLLPKAEPKDSQHKIEIR